MTTLPIDMLPEVLAPRGYVPAAEPLRLASEVASADAAQVDLEPGAALAPDRPLASLERLIADSAAARARMAYAEAAASCAQGAEAARASGKDDWAARFADEATAIALLSPPADDLPITPSESEASAAARSERGGARINAAIALALPGDVDAALAELERAEAAIRHDDNFGRLLIVINRAQALLDNGDVAEAARSAADALRAARREKEEHWIALASLSVALAQMARGRRNEARARLGEAARGFARYGDSLRQIQSHYLLGELAWIGEDPIRAGSHYRDALAIARPAGAQEWIELLTLRFEHR